MNYQQQMQLKRWLNKPFLTYAFLAIQIIVYLIDLAFPHLYIEGKGGMYRDYITYYHQYWRFITPIFIHFGFEHILFNSISLYFIGSQVEAVYGHTRYFFIYIFSGALGNAFSLAFNSPNALSAGASSSILGLFGAFLIFGYYFRNNPVVKGMSRNFMLFVVMIFVSSLFSSSVDFWGHLGGLAGGALLGNLVTVPRGKQFFSTRSRIAGAMFFIFLFAVCVLLGFKKSGFFV